MAMRPALTVVAIALMGCSRDPPPVLARAEGGNLVFDVQSTGGSRDCITRIAVFVEDSGYSAMPETGDDREGVEAGDYWRVVGKGKDQCVGSSPIRYGSAVGGSTVVQPKPLRVGPAYRVAFAEGATGYRMGRFRITPSKQVETLPPSKQPGDTTN